MTILDEYTYHVADTTTKLVDVAYLMKDDGIVGIDTETTSLKYYEQRVESIQVASNKHVVFIPIHDEDEIYCLNMIKCLQEVLLYSKTLWVAHNVPFDLAALHKIGIDHEGEVFCTMTAAHLLNETYPKGLKDIAASVFGTKIVKYLDVQKLARTDPRFIKYASHDPIYCRELYPKMKAVLEKNGQWPLASKIEMPFQHVLKDMRIHGVGADSAKAKELITRAIPLQYDLQIACHKAAGLRYTEQCDLLGNKFVQSKWNFNSSPQLIDIIENKLGFEITERTKKADKKTGLFNKSVGKKTKARLKNRCEFVKQLELYGKVSKCLSGFLTPFDSYIDDDGRMRSDFNNTGTVTGRPNSSDPNLLQLPKDNKEIDINFRECFIAPKGKILIAGDFSGQEIVVLADISGDKNLKYALINGLDVHLMFANEAFNLGLTKAQFNMKNPEYEGIKEKYKLERHKAKNLIVFPLIYGSGPQGIADSLNCSKEEAIKYINTFFKMFPAVKELIDFTKEFINQHGYAVNKSGRRRHFEQRFGKYDNSCIRQGFNFLVQGMSADITKLCCANCRREFLKHPEWEAVILMEIYDEILVECRDIYVEEVQAVMLERMKNSYKLSLPLEVAMGRGKTYQECK